VVSEVTAASAATDPVRVFIGSGEASVLERKTLIHSLRKHTRRPLDLYVFNGTHNAIERNGGEPAPAPMSLRVKYRNGTEFSLYRFLIPEICGFAGRAIWLDSDTVCLADIGELFDTPLGGADFLAKPDAYPGGDQWGLSVMLIDCARTRFDLEAAVDEIDRGLYAMPDLMQMSPRFLAHHPYRIGPIDPHWNVFDTRDARTKLIHYTNLLSQPWKYRNHPHGELWFRYFRAALAAGDITAHEVRMSIVRSYVRRDLLKGNYSPLGRPRQFVRRLAARVRAVGRRLRRRRP
jgi:hypothetical protein